MRAPGACCTHARRDDAMAIINMTRRLAPFRTYAVRHPNELRSNSGNLNTNGKGTKHHTVEPLPKRTTVSVFAV